VNISPPLDIQLFFVVVVADFARPHISSELYRSAKKKRVKRRRMRTAHLILRYLHFLESDQELFYSILFYNFVNI
jgi:hypothetical protein